LPIEFEINSIELHEIAIFDRLKEINMTIKGVIFDLDGTLLNSVEDIADSLNFTLKRYGYQEHTVNDVMDWIGEGAIELIRKAIPEDKLVSLDVPRFLWEYREQYRLNCAVKSRVYEGIPALLDSLEGNQISLNILSNKPHDLTILVAENFFSKWRFQNILGMRENIPRKPDPAAVLEISRNVNIPASELLYIGDSGTDIETAKNANIKVVAVSWGFRPKTELLGLNPDFLVDHPSDILQLIPTIKS
jgi:phosphoglycolate phosphatase